MLDLVVFNFDCYWCRQWIYIIINRSLSLAPDGTQVHTITNGYAIALDISLPPPTDFHILNRVILMQQARNSCLDASWICLVNNCLRTLDRQN